MTLPKFIICIDGTFRLGMVNQHKHLLIQPIDEHDLEVLDQEVEAIKELSNKPFSHFSFSYDCRLIRS